MMIQIETRMPYNSGLIETWAILLDFKEVAIINHVSQLSNNNNAKHH